MEYKVILWDFDGTLAYTSKDVWNSLEYAANELGGKFPEAFTKADSNLGKTMKEIFQKIMPYPGDDEFAKFEELVRIHYRQLSEYKDTHFYNGIYEILHRNLGQNIMNYIITMKPQKALERILKKKGWENLFNGWLSPDSFRGIEKTKGELIEYVLQQIKGEKSQYVYIGDTWSDVVAAHENGIDCIGVTYGDGDTVLLKEKNPKYCIDRAFEIEKILKGGV